MRVVSNMSEAELVEGCRKQNVQSQRSLYERYSRTMYGVCLRYASNQDDAQDILQEGFIRVFSRLDSFRGEGSLEGWIRRIMIHTSIEHYRKKSRYFLVDVNEATEVEVLPDALGRLGRQEVLELIQNLPAGYRTIFNLYEVEGFSHQEISVMMNVSVGTSKSQLSRAKSWLKERIEHLNNVGNFTDNHAANGDN